MGLKFLLLLLLLVGSIDFLKYASTTFLHFLKIIIAMGN